MAPPGFNTTLGIYAFTYLNSSAIQVCYWQDPIKGSIGTIWQVENTMVKFLPYLSMQMALAVSLTRFFHIIFKPLRQPYFVAQVSASIVVGLCIFGRTTFASIVPPLSNLILTTFAYLSLSYYMFLVGLEMDLSAVKHIGKRPLSIAIVGTLIPLCAGTGLYYLPFRAHGDYPPNFKGAIFWGITLSITSFPDLARLLSDIKLLHTDLGRMALNSAIISEITTWVLLIMTVIFLNNKHWYMVAVPTFVFLLVCWFLLRPGIAWVTRKLQLSSEKHGKNGLKFSDKHVCFVFAGVHVFGMVTDICGLPSFLGGFIFGIIFPQGELAVFVMEQTKHFITEILLPSFICLNGIRLDITELKYTDGIYTVLVVVLGTLAKILSAIVVTSIHGFSTLDGFALGNLINTKGVIALIVLNLGRSKLALSRANFAVIQVAIMFMTSLVRPIFFFVNKATKRTRRYNERAIQRNNPDTELRILSCIHSTRNLSGMINLLTVSNAIRTSPICTFAVHLVELTGRAAAMMIVHDIGKTNSNNNSNVNMTESEQIINAFENYDAENDFVSVYPLTAVSPYSTMHEDILDLAQEKSVAIILIPFNKKSDNHNIATVNQNLLGKSPCSVGILVDRGLGGLGYPASGLRVAMIFIGGPDDREALTYAWRMAGTPGVTLTVMRFLQSKNVDISIEEHENVTTIIENDDVFINEFRFKSMYDQAVTYHEKVVNTGDEIVVALQTMYNDFNLYITGRGASVKLPLTMTISEWGDDQEKEQLGSMGEALVSSDLEYASILVVQQSPFCEVRNGAQHIPKGKSFGKQKWASPILNPEYAFVKP